MTEEDRKKVIELWEKGLSGQAIGAMFGVSRCSILGIINRLRRNGYIFNRPFEGGRSRRSKSIESRIKNKIVEKKVKAKAAPKPKNENPKVKKVVAPKKEIKPIIEDKVDFDQSVDIMGLTRLSCRYPISEDNITPIIFCGKQQEYGSYCQYHGSLCYYPSKYQRPILSE